MPKGKKKLSSKMGAQTMSIPMEIAVGSSTYGDMGADNRPMDELTEARQVVARVQKWFFIAAEAQKEWRRRHIENMQFLSNDQWSEEAKAKLEGRPALVINRIHPIIMSMSGLQRKARQDIDLLPTEPDDAEGAEMMEALVKHFRDRNHLRDVSSKVFTDKISSGLGYWKLSYSFDERPQGDIVCERINPLSVFFDPNFPDVEWEHAEWVIHAEWLTMDEAIESYPEFESRIRQKYGDWLRGRGLNSPEDIGDTQYTRRPFWDPQTQRIQLLQAWYKTLEKTKLAIFADGEVEDDPVKVDEIEAYVKASSDSEHVAIVTRPIRHVRVAHVFDDLLFSDTPSPMPFNDFPIIPALGYYFWKYPFGMIDIMKDPQKEKNKRRTVITEIAGRAALNGWLNQRGGGADRVDLESNATGAGVVVEYDTVMPKQIDPPEIPQVLVYLDQQADREIGDVVNWHDEMTGRPNKKAVSGRAIEARQQGGMLTQEPLFDSFQTEEAAMTELFIEMIKANTTKEEALRILGLRALKEPQGVEAGMLGSATDVLDSVLSKAFSTKYDVVITTKPFYETQAMARVNALGELSQRVPIPPDIQIEAYIDAGILTKASGEKILASYQQQQQAQAQQPPPGPPGGNGQMAEPPPEEGIQ